jgi:hypothetical protein
MTGSLFISMFYLFPHSGAKAHRGFSRRRKTAFYSPLPFAELPASAEQPLALWYVFYCTSGFGFAGAVQTVSPTFKSENMQLDLLSKLTSAVYYLCHKKSR